jgi:hypothetical protein
MSAADQERARIQAILDAVDETLERADETLRRLDEQPDETVEAAPWPRSESDPSRSDELYRYGIKLADPHGLERWREEVRAEAKERERKSWRNWILDQEQRAEVEKWLRERILSERKFIFETCIKAFDFTTEQVGDKIQELRDEFARDTEKAVGQVVAELRKQLREEIQTAVDGLRAELNMQREHAAKFGEVIDLPSPLIRKVRDNAA